jgi:hypothetical protein
MKNARAIYDPQGHAEIERAKLDAAIEEFRAGKISEEVFRACLFSRGFRGAALRNEFAYHAEQR